jgi:hypothetical protein
VEIISFGLQASSITVDSESKVYALCSGGSGFVPGNVYYISTAAGIIIQCIGDANMGIKSLLATPNLVLALTKGQYIDTEVQAWQGGLVGSWVALVIPQPRPWGGVRSISSGQSGSIFALASDGLDIQSYDVSSSTWTNATELPVSASPTLLLGKVSNSWFYLAIACCI